MVMSTNKVASVEIPTTNNNVVSSRPLDGKTKPKVHDKDCWEKPPLNFLVSPKHCTGLWDTGSMVCLVNANWLKRELPNYDILCLSEVSERITNVISLKVANNSEIVLKGVAMLDFTLPNSAVSISVPFW